MLLPFCNLHTQEYIHPPVLKGVVCQKRFSDSKFTASKHLPVSGPVLWNLGVSDLDYLISLNVPFKSSKLSDEVVKSFIKS